MCRFWLFLCFCLTPWGGSAAPANLAPAPVISSFTIPGDWVQRIIPRGVRHRSLVPPKSELHGFQLSPHDARALSQATVIIGLNPLLEPWLDVWAKANHQEAKLFWLDAEVGTEKSPDPHGWTDPVLVLKMVARLVTKLQSEFPEFISETAVKQLVADIKQVDATLAGLFSALPPDRHALLTQHPNLGPFARRYGLRIPATILASSSAESADPSARHYSLLLKTIREQKVRIVLSDEGQNDSFARRLTEDSHLPPPLAMSFEYLDSADPTLDSWSQMMLRNGRAIHAALLAP